MSFKISASAHYVRFIREDKVLVVWRAFKITNAIKQPVTDGLSNSTHYFEGLLAINAYHPPPPGARLV